MGTVLGQLTGWGRSIPIPFISWLHGRGNRKEISPTYSQLYSRFGASTGKRYCLFCGEFCACFFVVVFFGTRGFLPVVVEGPIYFMVSFFCFLL